LPHRWPWEIACAATNPAASNNKDCTSFSPRKFPRTFFPHCAAFVQKLLFPIFAQNPVAARFFAR
jgi:hypothetical protein